MDTNSTDSSRRLLSLTEVAALCGVSRATARRLVGAGRLPASWVGGQLRVERLDLDRFLADSRFNAEVRSASAGVDEWSGDPNDLVGREDRLLYDADSCDRTFASKHEAFCTGFSLGERTAAADPGSEPRDVESELAQHDSRERG
jgi:excisionase family DNA binding protein